MKRERQNDDDSFRISPDTTCSNPHTNNNQNVTLSTTYLANINTDDDSPNATKGSSRNNKNNNKEQDRFLPIANVGRIMRKAVPGNAKFSKDAKETVQECVSEFISFVTGEASEKCQREKRKTVNGDDILWAIMTLGFEDYVNPLKLYLAKYRDVEGEKLNVPKRQRLQLDQELDVSFNNVYTSTSLIPQPPFPLPFSQSSMQTTTRPQQDHIDEHNW